jgi:hypothetical protein
MKKFEGTQFPEMLNTIHKRAAGIAKIDATPDPELFAMLAEGIDGKRSDEEKAHLRSMIAFQLELITDTSGSPDQWQAIAGLVSRELVQVRSVRDYNRMDEPLRLALRDILLLRPPQQRKVGG